MSRFLTLDVGTANGKAAILPVDPGDPRAEHRDPVSLLPPRFERTGMPMDAFVLPDGKIIIGSGESSGHVRPHPMQRVRLRAVKTALYQDAIECTNRAGVHFSVATADVYAAMILEMVTVANQVRAERGEEPLYQIVLTVPSIFTEGERGQLIMDKVRQAISSLKVDGHPLELIDTIPEAAGAAMDFLHFVCYMAPEEQRRKQDTITAVVYDLGAGTFDTALVKVDGSKGSYQLYHHEGLPFGGKNIDTAVMEWFVAQIEEALADTVAADELAGIAAQARHDELLISLACEVKEELSAQEASDREYIIAGHEVHLSLDRERFNRMIAADVNRTMEQIEVMLRFAREHDQKVDYIILTGGSSNIPLIRDQAAALAARYGVEVESYRTTSAVSFGAARYAYRRHQLEKHTGYRYSVLLERAGELNGHMEELIPLGATLPYRMEEPIELRAQHKGIFWLCRNLNEGDPADADAVENRKRLMRFRIDLPEGRPFLTTIGMDGEYRFTVECQTTDHQPIKTT